MSGRAGRRGIDDRGIVILIVDEKMGPDVGKELLKVGLIEKECRKQKVILTVTVITTVLL